MYESIVIRRDSFRENDQRIFLYTRERGLVIARAVGIKKISSKQSSRLQVGVLCYARIHQGKQGYRLLSAEPLEFYPGIRKSYRKSVITLYALGLISRIAKPGQPDVELFDFLTKFLTMSERIEPERTLDLQRVALWKLLATLGYNTRPTESLLAWHKQAQNALERSLPLPPFLHEPS